MKDIPRVLVVEDEADIRELITLHLEREGYDVDECDSGEEGARRLRRTRYDLLVLDWMLPGLSGIDIIRKAHEEGSAPGAPILMVTARAESRDIVEGLEAGADDYLTKPFEVPVLLARVKALLRRAHQSDESGAGAPENGGDGGETLRIGDLTVRPEFHEVKCAGGEIHLTPSEFKLLVALARNAGRVLTRDRLIELIQGSGVAVVDRTVDTHMFGLRKKLGECADVLETIRGVGYRVRVT